MPLIKSYRYCHSNSACVVQSVEKEIFSHVSGMIMGTPYGQRLVSSFARFHAVVTHLQMPDQLCWALLLHAWRAHM